MNCTWGSEQPEQLTNVDTKILFHDQRPHVMMFALDTICAGSELFCDYG